MKFVTDCALDLTTKVKTVPTFGQKTITVMSIDDLVAQLSSVVKPAVGILYEGARSLQGEGGKQFGVSGEVVFSILMLAETSVISSRIETTNPAHDLLDSIRGSIHGTRSPTGHFWKWIMEAPATSKGSNQVWIQRWSCPIQLAPTRQ